MQAIQCKYIPASPTKPSRVKASCAAKTIILSWDDERNDKCNMIFAAKALVEKMNWRYGKWIGGMLKDGTMVFVLDDTYDAFSAGIFDGRYQCLT